MFLFVKDFRNKFKFIIKGHKRLLLSCLLFLLFTLYLVYSLLPINLGFTQEYIRTSSLDECLNDRLLNYKRKIGEMDAVEYSEHSSSHYYSFVGNGYFGMGKDSENFVIRSDKSLSVSSSFNPSIDWRVSDYFHNERFVLDFHSGMFIRFQCYKQSSLCISVTSTRFAHRTRRELLIQELIIHNPTKAAIQIAVISKEYSQRNVKSLKMIKIKSVEYEVLVEKMNISTNETNGSKNTFYLIVFFRQILPKFINIPASRDEVVQHLTGVKYSGPFEAGKVDYENETKSLVNALLVIITGAQNTPLKMLKKEHENAWHSIWETGISIDKSLAPMTLNGHHINSTIYYLLSNTESFLSYKNISPETRLYYEKFLKQASHCYTGHDTLYATHLWQRVTNRPELENLLRKWQIILHKKGCGRLIKSGAHGLVQAVVYSAGSFLYAGDHISFEMHPNDLQRKLHFRNLLYKGNNSLKFDVVIDLDEENRPQIWVSKKNTVGTLYACDAGCVDAPIQLSTSLQMLPVKITKPRHPILYISDQLSHIGDLKHIIQVESIEDAKAHNHHIIALHKHGHSWGGLPPLFWCTIILLVVVFHLFLCKVIYTEYCRYRDDYDLSMTDLSRTSNTNSNNDVRINYHYIPSTRRGQYYKSLHY